MMSRLKSQKGDTIVEVLLAVAVVSSVLGIAYAIMNRNLQTVRSNQERTEATRLAQGQIEALKSIWGGAQQTNLSSIGTNGFCVINRVATGPLSNVPNTTAAADNFADYATCTGNNLGSTNLYNIGIKQIAANTYKVFVRWDNISGGERNEVTLSYRLQ